ncbi:hypothetical protein AALB39_04015 [Lachnospiraceae bacterium 54-53]
MITNPSHGWCEFKLGDFIGSPSYLTDVPIDLLKGFIEYFVRGNSCIWFDEEGDDFTLVLTPYSTYIIENKEDAILHEYFEVNPRDLAKELIADIENCIHEWTIWEYDYDNESNEYKSRISELIKLIHELKK